MTVSLLALVGDHLGSRSTGGEPAAVAGSQGVDMAPVGHPVTGATGRAVAVWGQRSLIRPGVAVGAAGPLARQMPGRRAATNDAGGRPVGVPPGRRLIAVIGPPGVGKSTATATVAPTLNASVFRFREAAERLRVDRPELAHLFATDDPFGWFRDETVPVVLAAFLTADRTGTVLLENLPGNAVQLRHIAGTAASHAASLQIVELIAPYRCLAARVMTRRVCHGCEPDPRGQPHRPARARPHHPDRCAVCEGPLDIRRSDHPDAFALRLDRFRGHLAGIRAAATTLGIDHRVIDGSGHRPVVAAAFRSACHAAHSPQGEPS